ncbi:MAG TPA: energy transducer TonB [Allosphingosinicella sp.]|jgi:protein TonB
MRFSRNWAGLAALAAALQLLPGAARAQGAPQAEAPARPPEPIPGPLIANSDYPAEAIARREQGAVRVRLSIDREGRVTGCSVEASSGSSALDSASCRLLSQRARFRPALDSRGEPVPGVYTRTIRWELPEASPEVASAVEAWAHCALGESARHAPTRRSVRDITRRAFVKCQARESDVARVLGTELNLITVRNAISRAIAHQIGQLRRQSAPSTQPAPRNR